MNKDGQLLQFGEETYRALRGQRQVLIDLEAVEWSIVSGDAGSALYRLMEQYRARETLDGKEIAIFERAMTGWILMAGMNGQADPSAAPLPISLMPPKDDSVRRALRLLSMVAELHKAGYQRLRIAAGMSPSGCHWRCHITSAENVRGNGWEPVDWDNDVASYTSGDEDRFFGWNDAPGRSARQLAQLFVERFPELASRGVGRDRAYAGWYVGMLGAAENGRFPVFFADYDLELDEAEMPPPVCRTAQGPHGEDLDRGLIDNEDLTVSDLPRRGASWEDIEPFCLTYDGYARGRRSVEECEEIANSVVKAGFASASMDDLRILLFIRQRAAKWNSEIPVSEEQVRFARAAIEEIRSRLAANEQTTESARGETILEVGAEGGSLRLVGTKAGGEWMFRLEANEDDSGDDEIHDRPVWLNSWRAALKALDKYPWPKLYPLSAHVDFRKKIASALKKRLRIDDDSAWRTWREVLNGSDDWSRGPVVKRLG